CKIVKSSSSRIWLIRPAEIVPVNPLGLPMATTPSPSLTRLESPSGTTGRSSAVILSTIPQRRQHGLDPFFLRHHAEAFDLRPSFVLLSDPRFTGRERQQFDAPEEIGSVGDGLQCQAATVAQQQERFQTVARPEDEMARDMSQRILLRSQRIHHA